jgi:NO-binding membrane sensor protein with MHYT domain/signal transduction histidine kinase
MTQHLTSHDGWLVMLSFVVAFLASYTALDMGTRLRRATGNLRVLWLFGSAVVLGGGIWSMHFVAMLALKAGVSVGYDFGLTALSLLVAIVFVAAGFHLVTRARPTILRQIVAGCFVGLGIAVMHYTGMAAVIVPGLIYYDPVLVATSVVISIVASTAALWLTLNLTQLWQRAGAAVVMAVAVCGMHYTAMTAASIVCSADQLGAADPLSHTILAAAVAISTVLILCLALVFVFMDRRFEYLADREAETLRAANVRLRDAQAAMRVLLDNADQGFLTVSADLRAGDRSSAACKVILGADPAGVSIIDLLYRGALPDAGSAMRAMLESVFRDSTDFTRDLKLSLLPAAFDIGGKAIQASYKWLRDSGRLMLILTDVTETTLLMKKVERERQRLEMIEFAVTEGEAFTALVDDYQQFIAADLPALAARVEQPSVPAELQRYVHTYKGLLAQFSFHDSPRRLHEAESRLSAVATWTTQTACEVLDTEGLITALECDLKSVSAVLGADFARSECRITLPRRQLEEMEKIATEALAADSAPSTSPSLRQMLQSLVNLRMLDAKRALSVHGRGMPALAARLHKQLALVAIAGDEVKLSPQRYGEFFRSLVHVFRNAVDHGIEPPEDRLRANKPAEGLICCEVRDHGGWLELSITDDGRGVNRAVLEDKLVAAGMERSHAQQLSLGDLVFREGLSSLDAAGDVSGRGIGMSAVKVELDRLGGSATVETTPGIGTCFHFRLPIAPELSGRETSTPERAIA